METQNGLNRHTKFALMAAVAAGIVSFIMITTFIDLLSLIFLPAVMIMVFVSAYFAFKRRMKNGRALTGRRIFNIALEVGTLSHFYTFALYLPLMYFTEGTPRFEPELIGTYIFATLILGFVSLIMFVWIAVPMYVGVGHILKAMEDGQYDQQRVQDEFILDDGLVETDMPTSK